MAHFRYGPCDLAHGPTGCGFLLSRTGETGIRRSRGGSDLPWGGTIGEVLAYAYLGRMKFSADARRLQAEGKLDGSLGDDRYLKHLAAQGDGLLERAASARTMYEELKRVADSERSHRNR